MTSVGLGRAGDDPPSLCIYSHRRVACLGSPPLYVGYPKPSERKEVSGAFLNMGCKPHGRDWPAHARVLDMYLSGMKLGGIRDECGVSRQRIDQMVRVAKQQLAHRVFFACPPAGTNVAIKSRRRKGENTVLNKLKYVLL